MKSRNSGIQISIAVIKLLYHAIILETPLHCSSKNNNEPSHSYVAYVFHGGEQKHGVYFPANPYWNKQMWFQFKWQLIYMLVVKNKKNPVWTELSYFLSQWSIDCLLSISMWYIIIFNTQQTSKNWQVRNCVAQQAYKCVSQNWLCFCQNKYHIYFTLVRTLYIHKCICI